MTEVKITFANPPPATVWRCLRFGFGLLWTVFWAVAWDNIYFTWLVFYKLWWGSDIRWSVLTAGIVVSSAVIRVFAWFYRKGGTESLTPRARWAICSRLKQVAYEHGVEAHELCNYVRAGRLRGRSPGTYGHFDAWHRAPIVCFFGLHAVLNDLVKTIGEAETEKAIRREGSLLLALAKASQ